MTVELASNMLAYSRSLEVTSATLLAGTWNDAEKGYDPIVVQTEGVRGQGSHAKDSKGRAPGKSNPQRIDVARMSIGRNALKIEFSLRVMPNALSPSSTDNPTVYGNLKDFVSNYADVGGFETLAWRYIENIANGRFAWRNRGLSSEAVVRVSHGDTEVSFDPFKLSLDAIEGKDALVKALVSGTADDLEDIVSAFTDGLTEAPEVIRASWVGKVEELTEVYPSQEYAGKEAADKPADEKVSRILASMKTRYRNEVIRQAVMHSQKIGAAIRCIDDWHGFEFFGPVPVNPFAGVQETGDALRFKKTGVKSFHDLIKKPEDMIEKVEAGNLDGDCHFFVANLVRGGVFGSK